MIEDKQKLYEDQKKLLDTFLKTGAIDKAQYEKSLNGLKEKMGIKKIAMDVNKVNNLSSNKVSIMAWNVKGGASILWEKDIKSRMSIIKDTVIDRNKDIVILTEFVLYKGIDELFDELNKKYYYFISTTTCYNGVLIALKKEKFNINSKEIFNNEKIVINNNIGSMDAPDFLEVYLREYNLYIIGTRVRVKIKPQNDEERIKYKESQINVLKNYIDNKLNKDSKCKFVIGGDWNMACNYLKEYLNNDHRFIINGNNNNKSIYSFEFPNNRGKILLDHFITINIADILGFYCDGWKFNKDNKKCSDHDIVYHDIIV